MSYIYALVARSKKIILTEYTEFTGNFPQISRIILNKVKSNKRCSLTYNEYDFFYQEENDLCFMLITKDLKHEIAFSFLDDMRINFFKTFDLDRIHTAFAYELKEFNLEIKNLMEKYTKNPISKNDILLETLKSSLNDIQESQESLIDRNIKLTIIDEKSNNLVTNSFEFRDNARKIKQKERRRLLILYSILAVIIIGIIITAIVIYNS